MDGSHPMEDGEAPLSTIDQTKRGGWITFPFIIATMAGMTLASGGWMANLIVYLIEEYKMKSIEAAQIFTLVSGFSSLTPVLAAVLADSFLGCFSVTCISSFISLLGLVLLFTTTILHPSSSQPCENGSPSFCNNPSKSRFVILYAGIALATLGVGGTRTTLFTMGANQFNKPREQLFFFNWFFFTLYTTSILATTIIVFVEDHVSWFWGFGISLGANALGLAIFLFGSGYYRHVKPEGSPFIGILRVVIATIRKRNELISMASEDYYYGADLGIRNTAISAPTNSFRFLNRAALKTEGGTKSDGSIAKSWNLCSVQVVEDLKTLMRILPMWSTSICLATPIRIQVSLSILQALTMDRSLGTHFNIPAGSIPVFVLISTSICLAFFDHIIQPVSEYLIGQPLTPLQRIGVGHALNVTGMAISAIIESKRLNIANNSKLIKVQLPAGSIVPMSVLWLVPQLVVVGIGEAFHFPGQVGLYYQEFPKSLKNLASAMISLVISIAFYMSTVIIDLVRRVTEWLPDDLNYGRLDLVYWVIVVIGVLNFIYFLVCAWLYKYHTVELVINNNSRSTN